jgi:hypothetical protein
MQLLYRRSIQEMLDLSKCMNLDLVSMAEYSCDINKFSAIQLKSSRDCMTFVRLLHGRRRRPHDGMFWFL